LAPCCVFLADHAVLLCRVASVLTTVRAVNKTDSTSLGTAFGTVADLLRASEEALSAVPGLGPTKVARLQVAFNKPFLHDAAAQRAPAAVPGPVSSGASDGTGAGDKDERDAREWIATQQAAVNDGADDDFLDADSEL
jgi:NAD-dependent DNA ligase